MSKGWMWVLAIAGLVGVVWVCNSWVNYAEEEERQLAVGTVDGGVSACGYDDSIVTVPYH